MSRIPLSIIRRDMLCALLFSNKENICSSLNTSQNSCTPQANPVEIHDGISFQHQLTKVGLVIAVVLVAIAGLVRNRHEVGLHGDGLVWVQLLCASFLHGLELQEGWKEAEICGVGTAAS